MTQTVATVIRRETKYFHPVRKIPIIPKTVMVSGKFDPPHQGHGLVECRICHDTFGSLQKHLPIKHKMNTDEYIKLFPGAKISISMNSGNKNPMYGIHKFGCRSPHYKPELHNIKSKLCACGCEKYAKPGNDFINGHNGKKYLTTWNKGLSKDIDDRIAKHSKYILENHQNFNKPNFCGENNPFYGKRHSEESKKLIGSASKLRMEKLWRDPVL